MYSIHLSLEVNKFMQDKDLPSVDLSLFVYGITINKTANIFKSRNYNLYQIDMDLSYNLYKEILRSKYIMHLIISEKGSASVISSNLANKVIDVYLKISDTYYMDTDKKTKMVKVRIFGINIVVSQMLMDNGISSTPRKQLLGNLDNPDATKFTTSNVLSGKSYDKFINEVIQQFYGDSCYVKYIGKESALSNTVSSFSDIPTNLNSIETIKYTLLNLWPILGLPMFTIDDFFQSPQLIIKLDELVTSNTDANERKVFSDIKVKNNSNKSDYILDRIIPEKDFESTDGNLDIKIIHEFNFDEIIKISKSDIVNSTENGIEVLKKNDSKHYKYSNNSLIFDISISNPFMVTLNKKLIKNDLETFLYNTESILNVGEEILLSASPMPIDIIDIMKMILIKDRKYYVYELTINLNRTSESLEVTQIVDVNANNFNSKMDIKAIDITNCNSKN